MAPNTEGSEGDAGQVEVKVKGSAEPPKATNLLAGGEKTYDDVEAKQKKLAYPKSVFFIIGNEFCERFSYYGMKAILTLYLKFQLMFSEDDSTIIYHVWAMLCYFTPVIGAIIADTFLGRFRTIFYISIIYVIGNGVLSLSAIPPIMPDLSTKIAVSLIGLLLIALGTGGIKPCVSAFGGDQFVLPQQERQLAQFFSIFYFSINAGSLISTFVTPVLRDDIKCFNDDCYSLAFGVPAVLMLVALIIFVIGYLMGLYKIIPPEGSVLTNVFGAIWHALRSKSKSKEKKEHWLDYASDKYEPKLINDVKILLKILVLYIPLPFFWALFDQQGSRWTFQATRMSGDIGGWTIKPDQMQVINPFFILMLIPIFDSFVYPLLAKCNILTKPLTRIFAGGVLAGVAFLISGFLELKLETTYPVPVKSLETRLSFINGLPCDVTLNLPFEEEQFALKHLEEKVLKSVAIDGAEHDLNVTIDLDTSNCGDIKYFDNILQTKVFEKTAHVIMITADTNVVKLVNVDPADEIEKSNQGLPRLRMLYNLEQDVPLNSSVLIKGKTAFRFSLSDKGHIAGTEFMDVEPETFEVFLPTEDSGTESSSIGSFSVKMGGVYDFMVHKPLDGSNVTSVTLYEVTPANTVHMLWLIPQYFVITVSEIMFSITGLEFSFMQAPSSMKSVLQAAWLLTVAFGNLIVVIIAEAKFFERQALEFFLFAVLMFVDMVAFAALAVRYKYVDQNGEIEDSKEKQGKSGKENEAYSDDETNF